MALGSTVSMRAWKCRARNIFDEWCLLGCQALGEIDYSELKTLHYKDNRRYNLYDTKYVKVLYNLRRQNKI
jgi:hypothetical protein